MKFGVRECCDVVLKAKSNLKLGNHTFRAGEPVVYFDTLTASSMEGAATSVYAQGGAGNVRLIAWEGEGLFIKIMNKIFRSRTTLKSVSF